MDDVPQQIIVLVFGLLLSMMACTTPSSDPHSLSEGDSLRKELDLARAETKKWKQKAFEFQAKGQVCQVGGVAEEGGAASPKDTSSFLSGEHLLYGNVIASYRQGKLEEAEYSLQLLLKAYPQSVHADNALFLVARLAAYNKSIKKGTMYLDQLLRDYPLGNKVGAALLEKGRFLRQAGKNRQAKSLFRKVVEKFPESLEADDAGAELENIL